MVSRDVILSKALKKSEIDFFDKYCTESKILMKNAANALFSVITEKVSEDSQICFVCGNGNNGGDGYACADIMLLMGYNIKVVCNELPATEDCDYYYNMFVNNGGFVSDYSSDDIALEILGESEYIIDCLYGIGFHGELNELDSSLVNAINDSGAYVISCDVPSGTAADTAEADRAVCADTTVVFTSFKASNVSYPAYEYNGEVVLKDIGIPKEILDNIDTSDIITLATESNISVPIRYSNSHKGTYGTLVMYCGSDDMIGAAVFAATAALRTGVGLVKMCTGRNALDKLQLKLSEPVFCDISNDIERGSAYLVGCGIGKTLDIYLENIFLSAKKPIVIDADGINYLSSHIDVLRNMTASAVLTPHPAEMARLLGTTVADVNSHRIEYAKRFAAEFNCVVVLKGARTVIASPQKTAINITGSDSLAKGGSGDMLAGMIGAYLAMGLSPFEASVTGCFMHGKIGENSTYHELISEMIEKI